MAETVEAGSSLAWRLLATLEGGSLFVAASALIAYTARLKLTKQERYKTVNTVLVSNTTTALGLELKRRLESRGCTVHSGTSNLPGPDKFDSLVFIGTESEAGLDGLLHLVSQDVNENLNLLETLSLAVRRGGSIAWVCTGEMTGAYGGATSAFDAVVKASLQHVAKISHCVPLWIGRCSDTQVAVDRTLAELLPTNQHSPGFAIRNAANKVSVFLGRWLKMVT